MTARQLAVQAGLSTGTVNDFLSGARWPRSGSLGKIEAFLGWPPGRIDDLAQGTAVGADEPAPTPGVLLDLDPDTFADLDPHERAEAVTAATLTYLERARAIRMSRSVRLPSAEVRSG